MLEISDSSSALQASDHPTYRGGLRGQGEGKLRQDINARTLMEGKGRELTGDAADIRALSMNHQLSQGIVDENLLRKIYDNQGPRIEEISKKFGVSIPIAAMALIGSPEDAAASTGGMGVQSAPVTQDEEAIIAAQQPAPTGADLMQQANDDFLSGIVNQPEPDFLSDVQQSLLSGIMKTAGIADLSADVASAMFAPVISAPGAVARYATGSTADEIAQARRETEDYFNYQPRTELGPQYGEQAMQAIGGAVSPYIPAIKEAAGESYILGAMKQGYDYLGEREKELAKALMDLSPY